MPRFLMSDHHHPTSLHARRRADLIVDSGLAPVATTVGKPRFQLGYDLAGKCSMIAPVGVFGRSLTQEEFEVAYRLRLDGFGVDAIRTELKRLAGDGPGVRHPLLLRTT